MTVLQFRRRAGNAPDLPGFTEHNGIRLCEVGEDVPSDIVALGHHDPHATAAAINAFGQAAYGRDIVTAPASFGPGYDPARELMPVHAWVTDPDGDWRIHLTETPTRDTFPVMYWSA